MILTVTAERFVYFDENGEITKITNYREEDSQSFIQVDYSLVDSIMRGVESSFNFMVVYDIIAREYTLKAKILTNDFMFNVNHRIHEITKNSVDADLTVIHDIKNSCWKFRINNSLQEQLLVQRISIATPLFFSITKRSDPNVLYRTLQLKFSDLLEHLDFSIPFVYNSEYTKNLSVYTIKKMQSYNYEVLDE
jgi:hypothetical protein